MALERTTRIAIPAFGVLYIALGIMETVRAVVTGDGGLWFWTGSLVGGGVVILLGNWLARRWPVGGAMVITLGLVMGVLATIWTVLIPLLAVAVMVLALKRGSEEEQRRQRLPAD